VCLSQLDLIEFLEQLAGVKFSVVFCPQALNGCVDALGVGSAEEFNQFSGPVHGFLLDLDHFGFICRDHMIHGPDVATRFHCNRISRVDLASLDRVLGLVNWFMLMVPVE